MLGAASCRGTEIKGRSDGVLETKKDGLPDLSYVYVAGNAMLNGLGYCFRCRKDEQLVRWKERTAEVKDGQSVDESSLRIWKLVVIDMREIGEPSGDVCRPRGIGLRRRGE